MGASFAVVPLLLAVPSGQAVDRFGERRVMFVGSVLTLVSAVGFSRPRRLASGACWARASCSAPATCARSSDSRRWWPTAPHSHRYDTAFGHYTFAASAGQAVGPGLIIVFGGANAIPDTQTIFTWAIALGALLVAACALLPAPARGARATGRPAGSVRDLLRRRGLVRALVVSCVVLAAVDISLVYLPALGTERGISAGTIGLLLTVRAVASMTSRFFLGRLVAWMGRARLLTTSIAIAAAGHGPASPCPCRSWLLVALIAGMGLGLGAGQPLTMSWLAEATPAGPAGTRHVAAPHRQPPRPGRRPVPGRPPGR